MRPYPFRSLGEVTDKLRRTQSYPAAVVPAIARLAPLRQNAFFRHLNSRRANNEAVIADLVDAGLVYVIATLRPLLTYNTRKLGDDARAEALRPVRWDEWITLPVREGDYAVRTARGAIRG